LGRLLTWVTLTLLLAVEIAAGWGWHWLDSPLPFTGEHTFVLERGTSMRAAAAQLAREGLLDHDALFTRYAVLTDRAGQIKAGSYALAAPLTPRALLDKLTDGDVTSSTITFVEGWTWRQVRAALAAERDLKHETADMDDATLLKTLGIEAPSPEGQFFPDTYHFTRGSSDLAVLRRAHQLMQNQLDAAWNARAANLPLKTPYEALILASIIEKETGKPEDRAMIAGVFHNRLRIGMRLQTDPSVIYGLGERFDGNLRRVDLETDTPYNTYTRAGLTPTPIAMPGAAALRAAVNPADTRALYFVAKGDGSSYFSTTLAEHNQAVRRYQLGAR
jgi:UPF0755 protein